jgi:hypothetical protein
MFRKYLRSIITLVVLNFIKIIIFVDSIIRFKLIIKSNFPFRILNLLLLEDFMPQFYQT